MTTRTGKDLIKGPTRRQFLQTSSALGLAAATSGGIAEIVYAQDKKILKVRAYTDMRSLDPAYSQGIIGRLTQHPHEFSGGMQQRISIAMALQAEPSLLIADEPTTALDATLEVQIIHLLKTLQTNIGCSILFISHHLGVIAELCDYVVVMYAGEVVEEGTARDVFGHPAHPYTERLLMKYPGYEASKRLARYWVNSWFSRSSQLSGPGFDRLAPAPWNIPSTT